MNIETLIDIVREASKLMVSGGFEVSQKEGFANIVTSSDIAVQEFLCKKLSEALPGCGFICEEEDINDTSHEDTFIIDPIDGTANYSRGIDQCAICVGLRHNDHMEMSVVYLPRTEELFCAEHGKGAFRNGRQIHVSNRPFADSVLCTAMCVYHKENAKVCSDIIYDAYMQCNDVRRFGAAAPELCYIAMGRCELYFEYMLSPWDYAAASLILTEAGGHISDLHGNPVTCITPTGVLVGNTKENLETLVGITEKYL